MVNTFELDIIYWGIAWKMDSLVTRVTC